MSDRYFVDRPICPSRVVLDGPEAHHLIHVMRATSGTRVVLFDGSGAEFPSIVERVGRSNVELLVLSREEIDRELPFDLTLGVALPKGDRQKWLVEKATELGVTRIVPLQTQRSVAQPADQALVRLRRSVVEASKQCGRNRLLQIEPPQCWPDFARDGDNAACRLLAHPGCDRGLWGSPDFGANGAVPAINSVKGDSPNFGDTQIGTVPYRSAPRPAQASVRLAVGPEGGFADDEIAMGVAAGWDTIELGPRILRIETAALLLVAMVATNGRS